MTSVELLPFIEWKKAGELPLLMRRVKWILQFFNTNQEEYDVVFTANATAAIKLVGECLEWSENDIFVHLKDNHTSVLGIRALASARGARVRCLSDDQMLELSGPTDLANCQSFDCKKGFGLFAFPAESNFCGRKYPLAWIRQMDSLDSGRCWFCLLDAAAFLACSPLNLKTHRPDFVCISFYKMFGFPTGIGALLVSRRSAPFMRKTYFGGGTVLIALPGEVFHISRPLLHDRLEDGTISFLDILAIRHGLDTLETLAGGMEVVNERTFLLGRYVYRALSILRHGNGRPVVELYCRTQFVDSQQQGPIVTFNVLRADGSHVGFAQVGKMAALHNIQLRTGCFCNTGACSQYLKLSDEDLIANYEAGHVCGDDKDLVEGRPTGAVRVSFGYMSTKENADKLLQVISKCFVEKSVDPKRSATLANGVSSWTIGKRGLLYDREWVVVDANGVTLTQKKEPRLCFIRPEIDLENRLLHLHSEGRHRLRSTSIYDRTECRQSPETRLTFSMEFPRIYAEIRVANGLSLLRFSERALHFSYVSVPWSDPVPLPALHPPPHLSVYRRALCGWARAELFPICMMRETLGVSMIDCGDKVAEWISDVLLNPGCRLLRQHPDSDRRNKLSRKAALSEVTEQRAMSLSNQSQFLLLSRSSLRYLLQEIEKRKDIEGLDGDDEEQLDEDKLMERFRANLVVTGKGAYTEDIWSQVSVGQVPFKVHGLCVRCQMVSIDQQTASPTKEPLSTLSVTRGHKVLEKLCELCWVY
uniref:Molybdenum cofactor sulfurase n=1 Tax=Strigamia maritima TaxID=126957 RepID=T1ISR7_STRMM